MRSKLGTLLLLALAGQAWAGSSLIVGPGVNTAALKVPATPPFTALGDYRLEFRVHDWTGGDNQPSPLSFSGNLNIYFKQNGDICARDYVDDLSQRNNIACVSAAGHRDVIVRVQRLGGFPLDIYDAVGSFWIEGRDIDGTPLPSHCNVTGGWGNGCPMSVAINKDWSARLGYIGYPWAPAGVFSLAWLKWFSTTVPPGSPFSQESTPADLADWRFEGNTQNQATGGPGVTIGLFKNDPVFAGTSQSRPTCLAGPAATFRAGFPAQLDGTGSEALNGDADLSYFWQQLSGPTEAVWDIGRNTARPQVSGTEFGSYVFRLTVTDSSGQSSSCMVKHGFVATDDRDVVITNNPVADTLLGPMIRFGANPWPWYDERHKAAADKQAANLDTYFAPYWESLLPGTIAVTGGSARVVGSGTRFTTDFCQGPANPTTVKANTPKVIVWYPNESPGGYGTRMVPVASCQSDTELTLAATWKTDVADCASGGCGYAYQEGVDVIWTVNSAPANFYDVVAAFYSLYYRSGRDEYLEAARKLADRFWIHQLDSGTVCTGYSWTGGCLYSQKLMPRNISLMGMILRATDGRPDMWTGLHKLIGFFRDYYFLRQAADINWGLWDIREEAYHMAMLSYGAMFSPDESFRASCKQGLSAGMNGLWNITQSPDGSWQQFYAVYNQNSWDTKSSVTLTHGSNLVTGAGTAWTSDMISKAVNAPPGTGRRIVFTGDPGRPPANIQEQEPAYYVPTYIDATHLALDRPYEGASGTHGWALDFGAVGWGTQPFIEGILGLAFEFTAQALAESDPANAAAAHRHNVEIANWLRTYGRRPAVGGMQYFAGTVDCLPPIPESASWCTAGNNASQARTLNAESLRSVMMAYGYTGDAGLRAFADELYNAMYAKPGTCPPGSGLCAPDAKYITDLEDTWGYYMSGVPPSGTAHKWFGMFFGVGAGAGWPAYRVGGARTPRRRPVRIGFHLPSYPGAVSARVTARAPSGETAQATCSSSPCTVEVDERQGDHTFQVEYLSGSGKVVGTTRMGARMGR